MIGKLYIPALVFAASLQAQTALYNTGNLRIHEGGQMGFHTDLINDGSFDENLGLVGFYSNGSRTVDGIFPPSFFDVEFYTENGTLLNTTANVANTANFITGDVLTPRSQPTITLNFTDNGDASGASDISKVDGYASITNQQNFIFPVGDSEQLRPLVLNSEGINTLAKAAYFYEDPNSPSTFTAFDTNSKPSRLGDISTTEFWRLEGSVPSTVQLSWNERSNIRALSDDVSEIVVVGFNKLTRQWESLGGPASVGDLMQGVAVSASFVPDNYEALTFGAFAEPRDYLDLENYFVSPNGDGINDFLDIPELALSPNNHMQIYNREGLKVFEQSNYTNEFNGFSNQNNFVVGRDKGLPSGVYFYIVSLDDLGLEFQGFLYLAND
ncbi:gliding motility-associated C-terminal domain-containing protein [Pseudozobellia thermophila]|uniref:Gliding motility-associated C-terminal domain-containing protein n=1 Tax=Pseudozobellia thermophila TaxID=192903 RepID=A0A1M6JUC8_9FLAO|nr:gliding motility-associated C-terminal domain-containing protein [Pseudozobellia thermophila]SHJ50222.1 gliding motility-associated C-terminal domain-containing protein [Pseudozobellia thermophila]